MEKLKKGADVPVDLSFFNSFARDDVLLQQLVLIEQELFIGLKSKELLGGSWTKADSDMRAPCIVSLTARFNYVSSWVVTEILNRKELKERRDIVSCLINIGTRARAMGSLNTAMEVLAGLNNGSVQRLKKTWEALTKKDRQAFEELEEFCSNKGSYKHLREAAKSFIAKEAPCLPYLGIYLADLIMTDEGSIPQLSDGVINFAKLSGVASIISEVLQFKKNVFSFPLNSKVRSYIINCTILDEDQCWETSYLLESKK